MILMSLDELIHKGYLQEANRQFFHPLGLALTVVDPEDGRPATLCVQDARDDPEGFIFSEDFVQAELPEFCRKLRAVAAEQARFAAVRMDRLGFVVQEIACGVPSPDSGTDVSPSPCP